MADGQGEAGGSPPEKLYQYPFGRAYIPPLHVFGRHGLQRAQPSRGLPYQEVERATLPA